MISNLLNIIFTKPFGYILMFIYKITKSYGLSIICFSILTKLILLPFSIKAKKNSIKLFKVQKQSQIIQIEHKNDINTQQKLISELYKNEGINPFNGIMQMLLTLPILFALFKVVQKPLTFVLGINYDLIKKITFKLGTYISIKIPSSEIDLANVIYDNILKLKIFLPSNFFINFNFLGINLSHTPSLTNINLLWSIPIISYATTYVLQYITQQNQDQNHSSTKIVHMILPLLTLWFSFAFPAGLGLYWITGNIFNIIQEYILSKKIKKSGENL